ncbi:DegV family protein [Candidatus Phytoplasma meliae]|uniref:DegV family protein n=1 Tax=Candidatus Phytoplasma meliae TaxID=1848402 RepID=A0ABS5CZ84_9MOLU|nr:DegV family protein [Candidatus Phytoplasma meliae]MBP5836169.1 DegV family protein [Candidatus Phytoplasma meliae]MBP5836272.1 DegV family protein [Candidatus Phytoplasma meliae]
MQKRKFGIVVDSTCGSNYGKNLFNDISIVPLTVMVDGQDYIDGTIDNEKLLQFIDQKRKVTTSQPNPELFIQAFQKQFDLGYQHIICLTLSHKLSGTVNSALLAKKILNESRITVIDTENVGPAVIFALKRIHYLLEQNPNIIPQALALQIKQEQDQGVLFCTVENLKILAYNGRISKFRALLGNLLRVHTILKFQKSILLIEKKVRSFKKCLDYLINKSIDCKTSNNILDIQVIYVDDDRNAQELMTQIKKIGDPQIQISLYGKISSVIAAHIGYKGFGLYINEIKK